MQALDWMDDVGAAAQGRRHAGVLAFVVISLCVTMSYTQLVKLEQGSLQYWLLLLNAVLVPLFSIGEIARALLGPARLLLVMLALGGSWHLLRGDYRTVLQLGLLVYVLAWVATERTQLEARDLAVVYGFMVAIGAGIKLLTDLSPYGFIPGVTVEEFGRWRVSFFPNIAYTGILSLALFLVVTRDTRIALQRPLLLALVTYFLVFSLVRTALIGAVIYLGLRWFYGSRRELSPAFLFWVALFVAVASNILIASSAAVVAQLQGLPLVSEVLLQGKTDLGPEEILRQMYRPYLWAQQVGLFLSSPSLMGWGTHDFYEMTAIPADDPIIGSGSEALPTRLLATYGVAAIFFVAFLVRRLWVLAQRRDQWACAVFPTVLLLLMHWGSSFHPTDPLGVIIMLMAIKGSRGFIWR